MTANIQQNILRVENLTHIFGHGSEAIRAVDNVSFDIAVGETLGLVGESGSGKTTTGRAIVGLNTPTSGRILYNGEPVLPLDARKSAITRRNSAAANEIQMVFQDPQASLDPRMTINAIIAEGPQIARARTRQNVPKALTRLPAKNGNDLGNSQDKISNRVADALVAVGLDPSLGARYPHELSGGQRQRVGIARALIMEPKLLVLDEPISALDVSIQAQVINLLADLKEQRGLTYLFVAHDLAMVRHVSDRIAVMQNGRIVEIGPTDQIFENPQHEFTKSLLAAAPIPDPDLSRPLAGI